VTQAFKLYEALLWEPASGFFLLEEHLQRLGRSATHFRFAVDVALLRERLAAFSVNLPQRPRKLRIEVSADGAFLLEDVDVKPSTPVRVALATAPVDSADEFLRHKTSRRGVYERAQAARPEVEDVLLWNERRELTETCSSNLVLEIDGRRLTPPVSSGLLPGILRCHLLERGEIEEEVLTVDTLPRASRVFSINSVRRWCELRLVGHSPTGGSSTSA
jgi:para-aminobenzoate synthetase/4-amino-4-deoxychorismate lyase